MSETESSPEEAHGVITSQQILEILPRIEQPKGAPETKWRRAIHRVRETLGETDLSIPFSRVIPRIDLVCGAAKQGLSDKGIDVTDWDDPLIARIRQEIGHRLALHINLELNKMFIRFLDFLMANNGKINLAQASKIKTEDGPAPFGSIAQVIYRIVQRFGQTSEERRRGFDMVEDFLSEQIAKHYDGKDLQVQLIADERVRSFRGRKGAEPQAEAKSEIKFETASVLKTPEGLLENSRRLVDSLNQYLQRVLAAKDDLEQEKRDLDGEQQELSDAIERLDQTVAGPWRQREKDVIKKYETAQNALAAIENPDHPEAFELPGDLKKKRDDELHAIAEKAPPELAELKEKFARRSEITVLEGGLSEKIRELAERACHLEKQIGIALVMADGMGDHSFEVQDFGAFAKRAGRSVYFKPAKDDIAVRFKQAGANPGRIRLDEAIRMEITTAHNQPFYKLTLQDDGRDEISFIIRTPDDLKEWRLWSADRDSGIPESREEEGFYLSRIKQAGENHFASRVVYEMAYTLAAQADTADAERLTIEGVADIIRRGVVEDQLTNKIGLLKEKLALLGLELEGKRSEDDETVFEYQMVFKVGKQPTAKPA